MRFSIMEREPEYLFDVVRKDLERLVNSNYNQKGKFRPCCEIKENEKAYTVKLLLPGLDKKDINIELVDNVLTVSAEIKQEEAKENENTHISEFSYGEYEKSIKFVNEIDAENSSSEYKNGILTITLNKKAEENKIEVKKIAIK